MLYGKLSFFLVITYFFCGNEISGYYPRKKKNITKENVIAKILSKTPQIWLKIMLFPKYEILTKMFNISTKTFDIFNKVVS